MLVRQVTHLTALVDDLVDISLISRGKMDLQFDPVDVAWRGGTRMVVTGNSFAAPHIAGYATRIRAAHPGITPFETKALLAATADNAG